MSVRSKYLPVLSARAKAHWAFLLARERGVTPERFTVTDAHIEHAGSTRADVEAFIDELDPVHFTVLRSSRGVQSWVRIKD